MFKAFATWLPLDALSLGTYIRVQSGTPWAARGQDTQGGAALNYLEPAGTRRNKTWTNVDLLTSYRLRLGPRATFTIEGRVLNLFDSQTQLRTDSVQYLTLASFTGLVIPASANTTPNPFYGTANAYAPPRRLVLGAKLAF